MSLPVHSTIAQQTPSIDGSAPGDAVDGASAPLNERAAGLQDKTAGTSGAMWKNVVALAVPLTLLGTIYFETFKELVQVWDIDPNYSHGFVVPVVSLLFAYLAWQQHGSPVASRPVERTAFSWGTIALLVGILLHMAASFIGNPLIDVVSLIIGMLGALWLLGGSRARRAYGFSVGFLIFMAPLPMVWYQPFAIAMQQIVSVISTAMLELGGVSTYREGYFIHVPGYVMEVGEACSGIRQLTAVLALAVAIGKLSERGRGYRWAVALISIPTSIAANCLRVVLTGVIMMLFGQKWAEGVYHTLEGLVIVALAAVFVVLAAWVLARMEDRYRAGKKPVATV